jgi:hypothetical protein
MLDLPETTVSQKYEAEVLKITSKRQQQFFAATFILS